MSGGNATAVLEASGMLRASEKAVVEAVIGRRPGVKQVESNPVAQTATVTYDPTETSVEELRHWIEDCGYHCAGQSVPTYVCDPLMEPDAEARAAAIEAPPHVHAAEASAEPAEAPRTPDEVMGHSGHGEMSMAAMVTNMRNRFLVAELLELDRRRKPRPEDQTFNHSNRPSRIAAPACQDRTICYAL